jgi:hypothetical protein
VADLDFACRCGEVRWSLTDASSATGLRYVCCCDDCQAFAAWLGDPRANLDAHGGTNVFQTPASRLVLHRGGEQLACVQVTSRPLLRWFCAACRTPIANTYGTARLSFLSAILVGAEPGQIDGRLGPSKGYAWTKSGHGDLAGVPQLSIPPVLWRMASRAAVAFVSGDWRRNALFDPATGAPVAAPCRLTPDERTSADAAAWAAFRH